MKYRKLGQTGLDVSLICLGTMTWGEQNTEAEGHEQMDFALSQGVNFFDTAELYAVPPRAETYGTTEEIIGNWFTARKNRDQVILASKIAGEGPQWIRGGHGIDRANITAALEGSLKRLQTDYIDLYQLHWPNRGSYHFRNFWNYDPSTQPPKAAILDNMLEVLETLGDFVKEGKLRYIGLSNETAWGTAQYLRLAEENGLPRMQSIQNEYSLLYRAHDTDLAELGWHENVGLLAYSPLADGSLSGKYLGGKVPQGSRGALVEGLWGRLCPQAEAATKRYVAIAKKHGLDPAQMALAFVNSRPFVTSNIIGATTMEQLETNIASVNVELSEDVMQEIASVHRDYPVPF